jgi:capsid protein
MLRSMAAGIGVSYATLSRDYSDSNYSSSRLALLDDRDNWRVLQSWLIENFHKPVFEQWLELAELSGELSLPGYNLNPEPYRAVRWIPRGWQWVDPVKEITAYKEAVRCGFTTQADVIAQGGGDIEDVFQQRQRELEMAADMDLVFDTDPGSVAGNGSAQADAAAPTDPAPADPEAREMQPQIINLNPAFEIKSAPPVEFSVKLEQERSQVKRTVRLIRDENGAVTGAETTEE